MNKIDELVVMAAEQIDRNSKQVSRYERDLESNLERILYKRRTLLNAKENWTWNETNKKRFVQISDALFRQCKKAWEIAMEKASSLEKQIAEESTVFDDYEIEILITPYTDDLWQASDEVDEETREDVCAYMSEECQPLIEMSISHTHYDNCLKEIKDGDEFFINKKWNWNTEYLGDHFKDEYICFAMHRLLDTLSWSFGDICSIENIFVDIGVNYQYCEKVPLVEEWREEDETE
jgi:hypothetical protein